MTLAVIGAASLTLAACESTQSGADYTYEQQAPFADERTVGAEPVAKAEPVFKKAQTK